MVAERDDVGAGGEELVGELRRDPDAVGDVLAVDDREVGVVPLAQRREVLLHGAAAGGAEDVCEEEDVQLRRDDRCGANFDRDVVAAVVRVLRERLLLDAREVDHGAELRRAAHDGAADGEGRVRDELRHRDDERGRALRLDVDLGPVPLAHDDERPDRGDDPVDRRVDVGPGQGADVERVRSAAAELVPARVAAAAAEDARATRARRGPRSPGGPTGESGRASLAAL